MTLDRDIGLSTDHLTPDGKKKRRKTREADKDPNRMWVFEQTVANEIRLKTPPPQNDFLEDLKKKKEEHDDYTNK